ncbi:MAG: DNA repair protein RadC [Bacteroidota bacterium]
MESTTIKSWAEGDRPREKLLQHGRHTLSDAELVAILIRTGTKNASAVDLAREILLRSGNDLNTLARLNPRELARIKGMGMVKAVTLVAALEIGRRRREAEAMKKEKITGSKDVVDLLQPHLADLIHEEFWLLLLNRANHIIHKTAISKGGISGTVVDPRLIFKEAIEHGASGIILSHNHPSGNTKPSEADIQLTKKLRDAGKNLDIDILDHIIIAGNSFFSFADEGLM